MNIHAHAPAKPAAYPHWYDLPHATMPITVPLYVAGIYLADFEAIVTVFRDGTGDFGLGSIEIEGQALNKFDDTDSRCEPVRANGNFIPARTEIEISRQPLEPTLETMIAAQVVRELDRREWTRKAEEALQVVERGAVE